MDERIWIGGPRVDEFIIDADGAWRYVGSRTEGEWKPLTTDALVRLDSDEKQKPEVGK